MIPVLKFNLQVPVRIFPEDDGFVSYCRVMDISSQGDTPEEAGENLTEAITGFITLSIV